MLNILRSKAQSTLIQAMVLVIALVFIFWGVGSNLNNNRTAAAMVNDVEIPYQEYRRAYDQYVDNFRQQMGGQLPPGLLEQLNVEQQVLAQLIQAELLRQGGREMGMEVSDLMVQRQISEMDAFQENGQFDLQRYDAILSQNRMTRSSFEGGILADLETNRISGNIGGFAMVSDQAVNNWIAYSDEEIKLSYIGFESADFEAKVEVAEEELATWFTKNMANYQAQPGVRLQYLFFDFADNSEAMEVSEEELLARYEADKESYQQPEQRHARHILFKVSEGADELVRQAQKKKAEEVLSLARSGADFAELASLRSEGPTKDRGGDLGFFPSGRMVPAFDAVIFSMESGAISELVETSFGYHIIKLEEVRPASTRSFAEVRDNLAAGIKQQKARGESFKRATAAYEGIMRAGSLKNYSEQGAEEVIATDYFTRVQPPEGVTSDPGFLNAAFSLNKGELSSMVKLSDGYAIVFVDDIKTPPLPELDSVREKATADYTREKALELAENAARELIAASTESGTLNPPVDNDQQMETSDFIKRDEAGTLPSQLVKAGFELPWKEPLGKSPVQAGKTFYVFSVQERRAGSEEAASTRSDEVRGQLLDTARNQLIGSWLARLQSEAKIWTNDALISQK